MGRVPGATCSRWAYHTNIFTDQHTCLLPLFGPCSGPSRWLAETSRCRSFNTIVILSSPSSPSSLGSGQPLLSLFAHEHDSNERWKELVSNIGTYHEKYCCDTGSFVAARKRIWVLYHRQCPAGDGAAHVFVCNVWILLPHPVIILYPRLSSACRFSKRMSCGHGGNWRRAGKKAGEMTQTDSSITMLRWVGRLLGLAYLYLLTARLNGADRALVCESTREILVRFFERRNMLH